MCLVLLSLLVAADAASRVELVADLAGGYATAVSPAPESSPHAWSGGGGIGATYFFTPLIDDATPLALQPYLERVSALRMRASVGEFARSFDNIQTPVPINDENFNEVDFAGNVDVDFYVKPWLVLSAGVGVEVSDQTLSTETQMNALFERVPLSTPQSVTQSITALPAFAGAGIRFGDTRIDLHYAVAPETRSFGWRVPYVYDFSARARTVLRKSVALAFSVEALHEGARGELRAAFFPSRRVGFFVAVVAAHGYLHANDVGIADRIGGAVGVSLWRSRYFGGELSCGISWTAGTDSSLAFQLQTLAGPWLFQGNPPLQSDCSLKLLSRL